jgi:four helix bundle protein
MAVVNDFRDLVTWQKAMELVPLVYQQAKKLPRDEVHGLSAQIRRAAVSIPANIAEGHSRRHTKEFLQHLSIARGSSAELLTLLEIAVRLGLLQPDEISPLQQRIIEIRRLTAGLMARLHADGAKVAS